MIKQQRGHCLPPGPQEMGKETRVLERTQTSRRRKHLRMPEALGGGGLLMTSRSRGHSERVLGVREECRKFREGRFRDTHE